VDHDQSSSNPILLHESHFYSIVRPFPQCILILVLGFILRNNLKLALMYYIVSLHAY